MNQQMRVLIVDDHTLFRESLSRLLESETEYKIVGTCASVDQALRIISEEEEEGDISSIVSMREIAE